jgi:golgi phosphoprotein 3
MLLAEELLLLALDDERGTVRFVVAYESALAGALLLDLALAARVEERAGKLVPAGMGSLDEPLLDDALRAIRAAERPRDASHWLGALPTALKPLHTRVAERLVERGVLDARRGKVLGLFPHTRYPERDGVPERELRERLRAVLTGEAMPDRPTALLIGLLRPLGLIRGLVPKPQRKEADRRAEALAQGGAVDGAVADAIQSAQMAILVASIAASTSAASVTVTAST